jgi:hypothetical protein
MRIYALPPLALRESPGDKTLNQQDCALTLRFSVWWKHLQTTTIPKQESTTFS